MKWGAFVRSPLDNVTKNLSHTEHTGRAEKDLTEEIELFFSVTPVDSSSQPIGPRTLPVKVRLR